MNVAFNMLCCFVGYGFSSKSRRAGEYLITVYFIIVCAVTVKLFRFCRKSLFMKLFKTTDMQVVEIRRKQFDFLLPSLQLDRRRKNFDSSPVTADLVKFVST